jgi:beta-lactamase class A
MLALVVVRKGFVYRSEHTLGRRDHFSFLNCLRDLQIAAFSIYTVLPALDRHRSPRAPLSCPGNAALSFRSVALLLLGMVLVRGPAGRAQDTIPSVSSLTQLEQTSRARIGLFAIDAPTNRQIEYHSQERFPMCSTFKVLAVAAVLKRVDEKTETLDRFVRYDEKQLLAYAPVTREHVKEGGMTLEALCAAAIEQSDNTAGNLVLEAIGGPVSLTDFARSLGDSFTRLDRNEPTLNDTVAGEERDSTTPAAMCRDLQRLFRSDFLSANSRDRLLRWMEGCQTGTKMIRASVPVGWRVGDKTGRSGNGANNDIGFVQPPTGGPIFLAIYVTAPDASPEARDNVVAEAAKVPIAALTRPAGAPR